MAYGGGSDTRYIVPDQEREAQEAAERRRQAYNPFNTDEQVVLDAEFFAFYKGVPVIRFNGDRSGSFGAIFLTRSASASSNGADTLRHEYGHTKQLQELGVINYAICIFIPSWQRWGSASYYDKPWEVTADIFGGVKSRNPTSDTILKGFAYLELSELAGIWSWLTIE